MKELFDAGVDRKGTACIKWDFQEADYGRGGLLPFSIADADYPTYPGIVDALKKRADNGVFGYTDLEPAYLESVTGWFARRHDWKIKPEWITATGGIVPTMSFAIDAFTSPKAGIVIQPPVYDPFYSIIRCTGRKLLENDLILGEDGGYTMDFEDLDSKLAQAEMMILCSPHNPICRVWTAEELDKLAGLCKKHNTILISDEIHWDVMLGGAKHTTMGSFAEISDRLMVCTSAGKTFNISGMDTSNIIIPGDELREKFRGWMFARYLFCPNTLGLEMTKAAYHGGDKWLDEALKYLTANARFMQDFLAKNAPEIKMARPEGTYLMWLDMRCFGKTSDELIELIARHGAGLNNGKHYGKQYDGFVRMNIACPRSQLEAGLNCILQAVKEM